MEVAVCSLQVCDVVVEGCVGSGEDSYEGSPLGATVSGGNGVGSPAGGLAWSQSSAEDRNDGDKHTLLQGTLRVQAIQTARVHGTQEDKTSIPAKAQG